MVLESNIIWIDSNLDNKESKTYIKELESLGNFKIKSFNEVFHSISHLKTI